MPDIKTWEGFSLPDVRLQLGQREGDALPFTFTFISCIRQVINHNLILFVMQGSFVIHLLNIDHEISHIYILL